MMNERKIQRMDFGVRRRSRDLGTLWRFGVSLTCLSQGDKDKSGVCISRSVFGSQQSSCGVGGRNFLF